jgi:hypothetical protein
MSWSLHRLRRKPWLVLGLALPAMLLRAAIPQGFMPAASAGTPFAMEMCPGHASVPVSAPAGGPQDGQPAPAGKHHEVPCVFAAAAGLAPTPFVATVDDVDVLRTEFVVVERTVAPGRPSPTANRPRAPPFTA